MASFALSATSGGASKHVWTTQKKRPKDGNNNGQLRIATPPWVAHAKPPGPKYFFLQISFNYSKILGESKFQPWEFPGSGLKAKDGKEKRKKKIESW